MFCHVSPSLRISCKGQVLKINQTLPRARKKVITNRREYAGCRFCPSWGMVGCVRPPWQLGRASDNDSRQYHPPPLPPRPRPHLFQPETHPRSSRPLRRRPPRVRSNVGSIPRALLKGQELWHWMRRSEVFGSGTSCLFQQIARWLHPARRCPLT